LGSLPQIRPGDVELTTDIRRLVDQRPTYGYRRQARAAIRRPTSVFPHAPGQIRLSVGQAISSGFGQVLALTVGIEHQLE
jgi:hypothetical protein